MKILAIDTSTKFLSVAITDNERPSAAFHDESELKHSSLLIPTIDKALKKSRLKLKDIEVIALSIGPGSFTGLRIGVATAKGINLSLGIPIVAVPTLDVVAYNFIDEKESVLCPLIDAKKGKVYSCLYEKPFLHSQEPNMFQLEKLTDYMLTDTADIIKMIDKKTLIFGDGAGLYGDSWKDNPFVRISEKDWLPKAEVVAKLGLAKAKNRQFENPDKLAPLYLHSKYCQVKGY